jgi:hypothetical protein|tara:strand:+ start:320 stop:637 length:318 start_codon:yes stop_codon:yes gene_type:complete
MAHYAKVENSLVTQVIVAEPEFFDTFVDSSPGEWIQTSYNNNIRKNYAGIGFTYDATRDAFYAPKPYPSWTLIEDTCQWEAPTVYPDDGLIYNWNEETTTWDRDS